MKRALCCGILAREIEHLYPERKTDINYLDPALHVDPRKLAAALENKLPDTRGGALILGANCHPDLDELVSNDSMRRVKAANCIEMLLGDRMKQISGESKTFFMTVGWLEYWRSIFIEGLKWDEIDTRQNFGYYDRTVLLDTGLWPIKDEEILDFFEYTQVPVEIISINLEHLKGLLDQIFPE